MAEALPTGMEFVPLHGNELNIAADHAARMRVALAITGKEFGILKERMPEELRRLAVAGTVFARMSPEQKADLVHIMQELVSERKGSGRCTLYACSSVLLFTELE